MSGCSEIKNLLSLDTLKSHESCDLCKKWTKNHENTKGCICFYSLELIFSAWLHISEIYLKNQENTASEYQKLKKKH